MKRLYAFTFLVFFILFSCDPPKEAYDSGENFRAIKKARAIFVTKNYPKAQEAFKELIDQGITSGDVYYYYGRCLQFDEQYSKSIEYYKKALDWFRVYQSEFPEDNNFDKLLYNYGLVHYEKPNPNYGKTLEIWDIGLKINDKNEFIVNNYDMVSLTHDYRQVQQRIVRFQDELFKAQSEAEVNTLLNSFIEDTKTVDLDTLKKVINPDITEAVERFETVKTVLENPGQLAQERLQQL